MRIALDSNILVYSAGVIKTEADRPKRLAARSIIDAIEEHGEIICPLQTFGEAYNVMQRAGWTREKCREKLNKWGARFTTSASSSDAFTTAIDLATEHKWQFWDALIINVAAEANCQLFLSEDLQPGFAWRGVTVANPFAEQIDPVLARLLTAPK